MRQREARRPLPRLRASEERPAVVRAPGTGWGWLARDKAAGKGRQVTEGPMGHAEEHEVRKGGEGCPRCRKILPGTMQRWDGGKEGGGLMQAASHDGPRAS